MRLPRIIVTGIALTVTTLTLGILPAQSQPTKEEPAPAPPSPAAARALAIEAQGARASQIAASRGALGSYFDEATNQHVIVVTRGSNLGGGEVSRVVGAATRIEQRDISKATVDTIQSRIAQRGFHAKAKQYSYASYLDLTTGKVVVDTDAPAEVTAALSEEFPGAVELRAGGVRDDFSRQADTSPFWGGSSIKSGGFVCSSGFVVKKSTGTRYLLTAGHCFAVGANVLTTGGNLSVGTVVQRGPIPPYDMELIGGKSYGSSVFVGGTNSSTGKSVIGAGDPAVGFTGYCRSGQTTGEKCNQKVISVTAQVCTGTGCKSPVIAYNNGGASGGGDSGAPFYLPSGTSNVYIRGLHIAAGGSPYTMYAEKWSRISANLGVSIVTSAG